MTLQPQYQVATWCMVYVDTACDVDRNTVRVKHRGYLIAGIVLLCTLPPSRKWTGDFPKSKVVFSFQDGRYYPATPCRPPAGNPILCIWAYLGASKVGIDAQLKDVHSGSTNFAAHPISWQTAGLRGWRSWERGLQLCGERASHGRPPEIELVLSRCPDKTNPKGRVAPKGT